MSKGVVLVLFFFRWSLFTPLNNKGPINCFSVIKAFHVQKKPIGLCCIAPVLAAKVLPGSKVTVGSDVGTIERISAMGSTTTVCNVEEVVIDKNNLLVTTPAYMLDQPIHKVYEGITKLVKNVLQLTPLKANDESSK
eukprot:TRINITY_DN182_c0_g1_i4.p1 TRINITY_DN182_c0_g1~~TRINITY_DN182_c0_g1_i4.p1  ORF type:complete len:137 (+),score=24.93 TRINITY_DN182_c0_g1_i4:371-781(+)